MTNSAAMVATDDEIIDPEVPVTRKSCDIKTKHYFIQTIDKLIASSKYCHGACAFSVLVPLYYRCWKRLLTKVDDAHAFEEFVAYST